MPTRRDALALLCTVVASTALARRRALDELVRGDAPRGDPPPRLAPGTPNSAERRALVNAFKQRADKLDERFEARTWRADWTMPYRLFRPSASGALPLVVYLHGSGGLGTDNVKQLGLGNVFGTRLWALPDVQRRFPCYVLAPQTDRGWMNYGDPAPGDSVARVVPGLGDGVRLTFAIIDALVKEFSIDARRIYLTGQSMGGGGVWHATAQRPGFFAAAATCCGSASLEPPTASIATPFWNFHGDADATVPVTVSRDRLAALRNAGASPIATEYAGVRHNVWEWAYTEPALAEWLFAQRRRG